MNRVRSRFPTRHRYPNIKMKTFNSPAQFNNFYKYSWQYIEVPTRICFKEIVEIEPIRNNHDPSCVWRVYYELKDPNIEFSDDGNSSNSNTIPSSLPEDEPSLKKLFNDTTAQCDFVGMNVLGKYHTQNRSHAVVEYSIVCCQWTQRWNRIYLFWNCK